MSIYQFKELTPSLGQNVYFTEDSVIIGNCELGDNVNVWFKTVLRGDVNKISIGKNTNVQDLSMLHVTEKSPLVIGENVSIGHSVTLHGCIVGNSCLIGMGATVLDDANIGNECIVAAGSLVPPGKVYPDQSMIMGNPAKVVRKLKDEELNFIRFHYKSYLQYSKEFRIGLKKLD